MKAFYKIFSISAAALLMCCCTEPIDVPEPGPVEQQPETRTLTFVLSAGEGTPEGFKTVWEAGDRIVVHGEYAKNQVVVELAASDISADGKSATKTVENLYPYEREDCHSSLYASYPAEAVDNLTHCFFYSKFSTTNAQLLAACNDGDTFNFEDVCGALCFNAGDYDSYSIVGKKKETLGYSFLQVKLTDNDKDFLQYRGEPVITLEGDLSDGEAMIFLPDGITAEGCTIKFKKDGKPVAIYKGSESFEIVRGAICDWGDISDGIEPYDDPFSADVLDLDANGNANCYILTAPGKFKFKAVKGNSATSFFEDPAEVSVLWECVGDAEEFEGGKMLKSVSFAEDYIIINTPDVLVPGNVIIALKDSENNIIWSWHLWIPATAISNIGGIFSTDCMDRNLGALIVCTPTTDANIDPKSYGMNYQWGRKDPYPSAKAVKSSSVAYTVGAEFVVASGQISLEQSIANPTLLGHTDNGNWLNNEDNTLWADDAKTIYDPCPPGYRVPSSNSCLFWGDLSAKTGWNFDKTNGWFVVGDPVGVFPLGGYRDDYSVGSMAHAYDRGLYWSAAASSKAGYGRGEDCRPGSSISYKDVPKARAGHVRCVVE